MTSEFNGLLVEGIPGAGKSTLIDTLIRRHVDLSPPRKLRTFVHLAQTHTYGPLAQAEDDGTLTVAQNRAHLDRVTGIVEWLRAGVEHERHPPCFVLIDTLHLTHCVRPGLVAWSDVEDFDRRLAAAGCKLLLMTVCSDTVWRRTIQDRSGSSFGEYAAKFGATPEALHAHFLREQEAFEGMFARSALPKLQLPGDDLPERAPADAHAFWLDRDGAQ